MCEAIDVRKGESIFKMENHPQKRETTMLVCYLINQSSVPVSSIKMLALSNFFPSVFIAMMHLLFLGYGEYILNVPEYVDR